MSNTAIAETTGITMPKNMYKGKVEVKEVTLSIIKPAKSFAKVMQEEQHNYDAFHETQMEEISKIKCGYNNIKYK